MKNRAAAPIQITAEQLLREARERGLEEAPKAPKQYIADNEELQLYRQNKRKDFEDQIRRQRQHIGTWCKYALWEASQKEFERARSVFERGIDIDYRNQTIWFKYAEMEMKNKFINHARNVWDRAVALHPRVDNFWYKYTYMEELVGQIEAARQVFERWMKWEPDDMAWSAYIKFECRQEELGRARGILERYVACHPTARAYLKYARWEERQQQKALARVVYERALIEIPETERRDGLMTAFARFEERCKEFDRARAIYKFALDSTNREESPELFSEYASFEKRHGDRKGIEDVVVAKKRSEYERTLSEDPYHYDTWFDYTRLEEAEGNENKIREIYERSIANIPPIAEKRYWRRYIYLWINYAVYEELTSQDVSRARDVYKACLSVIPHKTFTFGKIWLMAAHLEVRQKDLTAARKLLGMAIGMCGKENIFKGYIQLELQLGEVERCRSIYAKYLEVMPHNCTAWKAFAGLETNVGETARARAIFELAISQVELDMPEVLWKAYIDFEIGEQETENVRRLYRNLLDRTNHVKVWISFAQFEVSINGPDGVKAARLVYQEGYDALKQSEGESKEERVLLLEAWRTTEADSIEKGGDPSVVESKWPRKVKMRRDLGRPVLCFRNNLFILLNNNCAGDGLEDYYDYVFPDDAKPTGKPSFFLLAVRILSMIHFLVTTAGLKILENAMKWKQMLTAAGGGDASNSHAGEMDISDVL